MNRRETLKNLAVASVGLVILPSWTSRWTTTTIQHASSFSLDQQEILSSVVDTIIPAGDSIGALSAGVDKFLQKLFDDCYEKDVRENIKAQLTALEFIAQTTYKTSFHACMQTQRQELLVKFAISTVEAEKDFFDLVKSETIRGFNTSQEVMEKYLHYKPAPGNYVGCVAITA